MINSTLANIDFAQSNLFSSKEMKFIGSLINSLFKLPNYYGQVHRGIRNFRFSSHQKVSDCFSWKGFTSTSKKEGIAEGLKNVNGTIFHINCLTGRDISLFSVYSSEEEVLLLPFTYFMT